MKTKWKVVIGLGIVAALAGGTAVSLKMKNQGQVTVQTGRAVKRNLAAVVTAAGEIKPKTYTYLTANAQGRIIELMVAEGDRVRKGQIVARVESVQAQADVEGQRANVASVEADSAASEVGLRVQDDNIRTQEATIDRTRAQVDLARIQFDRVRELWEAQLIARQEYDQRKAEYDQQQAALREAQLRLEQMKSQRAQTLAQVGASQRRVAQARAQLNRVTDVLDKHNVIAPIDGIVTNLPVRIGETVVPGIQNSAASAVMTIADLSLITAEVKIDETDIVNLALGQATEIEIDAIPNKKFKGHVIEIGNTAILRSTGQAASSSATSSNEAKDFKVVVALDDPPELIRPGLSCTAKITTSVRDDVVSIPIQALTVRSKGVLDDAKLTDKEREERSKKGPIDLETEKARREEITGVFVVKNGSVEFRKVETGIAGSTEIEVLSGLQEGEEIVIGSYQVIRTMQPGARVTIDNSVNITFGEDKG